MEKTRRRLFAARIFLCITGLVALAMIAFIMVAHATVDFHIQWNMFHSVLRYPLLILGFLLGLGQKFEVYDYFYVYKDRAGNVTKVEKNSDPIDGIMGGCLFPLLQYFVLYPILYAALIYYPLMALLHLFGKLFPFFIIVVVLVSIFYFYKFLFRVAAYGEKKIWMFVLPVVFIAVYWLCYFLWVPEPSIWALVIVLAAIVGSLVAGWLVLSKEVDETESSGDMPKLGNYELSMKGMIVFVVLMVLMIAVYSYKLLAGGEGDQAKTSVEQVEHKYVVRTKSVLNVRSGPGTKYKVMGAVHNGDTIRVLDEKEGWAVFLLNGDTAYISAKFLEADSVKTAL